ncbi:MAG: hypothetical protein IPJ75_09870 [Ignavibacteriales bacterium]|nr:hypothetical protein [Ignavibacteriales bacterium]
MDILSHFIASDEFGMIRKNAGEMASVDTIFSVSLRLSSGNISLALAACTWSCLTVKTATVVTPILGTKLTIPFFSTDDPTFGAKNKNLPRYFFEDSPVSSSGDVDKLAHFFGSAYLQYISFIPGIVELFGYFIEVFEESFKVDSKFSTRDIIVNKIGIKFGNELSEKPEAKPSDYLKQYKIEK